MKKEGSKIAELKSKIKALNLELAMEQLKEDERVEKECQWVVGKCIKETDNCARKIINVYISDEPNVLQLESVYVNVGDLDLKDTSIQVYDNEHIPISNLKKYIDLYSISNEEFEEYLDRTVETLKKL